LQAYEEERKVPYTTSVERIGYDRGKAEGKAEEAQSMLIRQLTRKFGILPDRAITQIQALAIAQLESLSEELLDFGSVEDLTTWLNHQS
jgi:predicted transposase YdaD